MSIRDKFNPKRTFAPLSDPDERVKLAKSIRYVGSQYHKRDLSGWDLEPPARPLPTKMLCEHAGKPDPEEAKLLLMGGICFGAWGRATTAGGYPKHVWSVREDGTVFEAQGDANGNYHGYPMQAADPYRERVVEHWKTLSSCKEKDCSFCGGDERPRR